MANRLVAPARAAGRRLCRDGFPKDRLPVRARTDSPRYSAMKNRKEAMVNMHQVLIKRRDALRQALAGDLSKLKELRATASGDVVDWALDSVQDEISSQLAEVESRELARIEIALERMREGQYGICEGCGCSIPMARLNALPYATLCIKCQRESEREGGSSGGGVDWTRLVDMSGSDADVSINDIELDVS